MKKIESPKLNQKFDFVIVDLLVFLTIGRFRNQ